MAKQACKTCKRLVSGEKCPICKDSSKLIKNWKGKVVIFNVEKSELAKKMNIKEPGEYAVRI